MTYKKAEAELAALQAENETVFRTAVYHLHGVGARNLTDENAEATCKEIMKQDDSHSFVTNDFQCAIVRMAAKLAKYDLAILLKYLSKHLKLSVS